MLYQKISNYIESQPNSAKYHVACCIKQLLLNAKRWMAPTKTHISSYLKTYCPAKLHIGAGYNLLEGWLNTDFSLNLPASTVLDVSRPFPIPDASFDFIFSEHVIEHLTASGGEHMLRECKRILAPGGVLRIATPDLQTLMLMHMLPKSAQTNSFLAQRRVVNSLAAINQTFYAFGHRYIYDEEYLRKLLHRIGFTKILRVKMGESEHRALRDIETKDADRMAREFETVTLEASV